MALYVFITRECAEDAKRHNRHEEMLKLKRRVEEAQRICLFDNFPPPYLKKRFDRQFRLLADFRTVRAGGEDHVVVSFLRVLVRGKDEYAAFINDPAGYGRQHLAPLVDTATLEAHLAEQLRVHPVEPKARPSDTENHFLYRLQGEDPNKGTDAFVCESEQWVRAVEDSRVRDRLVLMCEELCKIADEKPQGETRRKVREYEIVCRWFGKTGKLYLAGIARDRAELTAIRSACAELLEADEDTLAEEEVLRRSVRAYPAVLLADEDAWMGVQKDLESNLALSPEEADVLESVHRNEEGGYPIFINGRAGSGKSTILYYLFADYVNLYLELRADTPDLPPPLLLSCGGELMERARKTVGNLLRRNPRWGGGTAPGECFRVLQDYLLGLVPHEDREREFPADKYVDYARFRRMWVEQFDKVPALRAVGPDTSWHVIRTYIKGSNPEGYLEPEEYAHLPRKQLSVSMRTFETVFAKVWSTWYRPICEDEGFWDDQDLARHVFDADLINPCHPAVFCDEAQDFTRVELDLVFRLCLFTNRRLRHEDLRRVPFAFAGDPFQTLNPTGFRWDAIQAQFHDTLTDTLGENLHRAIDLNYQELSLNYRSTQSIVKLCNLVQVFRSAAFDIPGLRPQQSWQSSGASPMPVWFDHGNPGLWSQLGDERDITILVPCMLNEEKEYVENDPILRELVQTDDSGVPLNVLSPARAKGLEFARVALYRFAASAPGKLMGLLDQRDADPDQLLPFEYFVNRLYVAVSRPKRRLFIIEDQEGRDDWWRIAIDEELQQRLWERMRGGREIWLDHIGGFEVGAVESWSEDRGDQEENARRLEEQGMATKDPFLLRSAALSYENTGKPTSAHLCRARACECEGKPREAGDFYRRAGNTQEALRCFWAAGLSARNDIFELHKANPEIGSQYEYKLAALHENPDFGKLAETALELADTASKDPALRVRILREGAFAEALWGGLDRLATENTREADCRAFLQAMENLAEYGLPRDWARTAELHYHLGDTDRAIACWEKGPQAAASANYKAAKAAKLAAAFKADASMPLSLMEGKALADFFSENGDHLNAMRALRNNGGKQDIVALMRKVPESFGQWQLLFATAFERLAELGDWDLLIDMARVGAGRPAHIRMDILKKKSDEVAFALAGACARNESFAGLNENLLKHCADVFNRMITDNSRWRKVLTVEAAGTAIERTGRQKESLAFYDSVIGSDGFSHEEKQFARRRWLATKERQARRMSEGKNEKQAQALSRELGERRRKYGIDEAIPEDPPKVSHVWVWERKKGPRTGEPPAAAQAPAPPPESSAGSGVARETARDAADEKPAAPLPDNPPAEPPAIEVITPNTPEEPVTPSLDASASVVDLVAGDLRFSFSRTYGRVNITHSRTLETASIIAAKPVFQSQDLTITEQDGVMRCDAWDCACRFERVDHSMNARVTLGEKGVAIEFSFPLQQ